MIRKIDNICIVGTSHIAKKSIEEINYAYADFNPDAIAIELDIDRLRALLEKKKRRITIREIISMGIFSYIFALIAKLTSERLAKIVNTEPGIDMLEGFKIAQRDNKELLLIDRHINLTLNRLNRIPFMEKLKMFLKTFFISKKELSKYGLDTIRLNNAPDEEFAKGAIMFIKNNYPKLYKILIDERNRIMARNLSSYNKKVLAIMGAGHVEGVIELLERFKNI